jgi:hypothetical protein
MKNTLALSAAVVALLMTPVARSYATTVVLLSPQIVSAVDNLLVGGTTYDVKFVFNGTDTTFAGNASGALAAASALEVALNGSTASFVHAIGDGSESFFDVQDNGTSGVVVESFAGVAGSWQVISLALDTPSVAVFTTVPEPSTWAMMALGFAGLGFAGWRSRRRSVSVA